MTAVDPRRLAEESDEFARGLQRAGDLIQKELARIFAATIRIEADRLGVPFEAAMKLAKLGESTAQGNRSRGGRMFEMMLADGLKLVARDAPVYAQWKVPGHKDMRMDLHIPTRKCWYFFSLKMSTAERAALAWEKEYLAIKKYCAQTDNDFRFIGLTRAKVNLPLLAKLKRGVEYMSTSAHDAMANLFIDIWEDGE